jgi:hypothetical protein
MATPRETFYRCTYSLSGREQRAEFIRAWDPVSAATQFLQGLGRLGRTGGTVRVIAPSGRVEIVRPLAKAS